MTTYYKASLGPTGGEDEGHTHTHTQRREMHEYIYILGSFGAVLSTATYNERACTGSVSRLETKHRLVCKLKLGAETLLRLQQSKTREASFITAARMKWTSGNLFVSEMSPFWLFDAGSG